MLACWKLAAFRRFLWIGQGGIFLRRPFMVTMALLNVNILY